MHTKNRRTPVSIICLCYLLLFVSIESTSSAAVTSSEKARLRVSVSEEKFREEGEKQAGTGTGEGRVVVDRAGGGVRAKILSAVDYDALAGQRFTVEYDISPATEPGPGPGRRKLSAADYVSILNLFPCAADAIAFHQELGNKVDLTKEERETALKFDQASYASGSFVDGLFLFLKMRDLEKENLNLGADENLTREQSLHLLELDYPLSSFGKVDACKFIGEEEYHYCHFTLAGPFWKYGLCLPSQCTTDDVQLALDAIFGPQGIEIKNPQCGDYAYDWLPGTYVMVIFSFTLVIFLLLGTLSEIFDNHMLLVNPPNSLLSSLSHDSSSMPEKERGEGSYISKRISSISKLSDMLTTHAISLQKKTMDPSYSYKAGKAIDEDEEDEDDQDRNLTLSSANFIYPFLLGRQEPASTPDAFTPNDTERNKESYLMKVDSRSTIQNQSQGQSPHLEGPRILKSVDAEEEKELTTKEQKTTEPSSSSSISLLREMLRCFSLIRNIKSLIQPPSPGNLYKDVEKEKEKKKRKEVQEKHQALLTDLETKLQRTVNDQLGLTNRTNSGSIHINSNDHNHNHDVYFNPNNNNSQETAKKVGEEEEEQWKPQEKEDQRRSQFSLKTSLNRSSRKEFEAFKVKNTKFDCFEGMRSFSVLWVIWGHIFVIVFFAKGFTNNYNIIPDENHGIMASYFWGQSMTQAYYAVDTFLFIAGFLIMYFLSQECKKMNNTKRWFLCIPAMYLKRFLRLSPAYYYVLLMYFYVFRILNPPSATWNQLNFDYEICQKYIWSNFLFVNNFVMDEITKSPCYLISWYLAVDFQLFLVAPILVWVSVSYRRAGLGLLIGLILANFIYSFTRAEIDGWNYDIVLDQRPNNYVVEYYFTPWCRSVPYLMGMLFARFYEVYIRNDHSLKKTFAALAGGVTFYSESDCDGQSTIPTTNAKEKNNNNNNSYSYRNKDNNNNKPKGGRTLSVADSSATVSGESDRSEDDNDNDNDSTRDEDSESTTNENRQNYNNNAVDEGIQNQNSRKKEQKHIHINSDLKSASLGSEGEGDVSGLGKKQKQKPEAIVTVFGSLANNGRDIWSTYALFVIAILIFAAVVYGGQNAFSSSPPTWSQTAESFYITFNDFAWSMALAFLCFLVFTNKLPVTSWLLQNQFMIVTSRLSYCLYLCHPLVIFYYTFTLPVAPHLSFYNYLITYMGICVGSYMLATIVYLGVEKPIANFFKVLENHAKVKYGISSKGKGKKKEKRESLKGKEYNTKIKTKEEKKIMMTNTDRETEMQVISVQGDDEEETKWDHHHRTEA